MAEKPTAAFVLSLIGGIIYLLVGVLIAVAAAFIGSMIGMAGYPTIPAGTAMTGLAVAVVGGIGLVSGVVMLVGAVMMNSSDSSRVRTGAILVLIFALIGAIFTVGGFVLGFILALVGSILGLTWKPPTQMAPSPMPPTT